jgi:peptidoglycan/xylan/chitin deacetylase (PgdA/CDA1 family)
MRHFILTFDTEDFINPNVFSGLFDLLTLLKKHEIQAIFFITGNMAEKIAEHPEVLELLEEHLIGYHSSSHSVHPTIFEFTDVENYDEARKISMLRETSHVDPLTGELHGSGGIYALRKLFPSKRVDSFRAPGFCWSPPHLEALRDLGIKYDFSTRISKVPFSFKGLTFYPYPQVGDWRSTFADYRIFWLSVLREKYTTACLHPSLLVNEVEWDRIYWKINPEQMAYVPPKNSADIKSVNNNLKSLMRQINLLQKTKMLSTKPLLMQLIPSERTLTFSKEAVDRYYESSIRWPRRYFNYEPKFIRKHFESFFEITSQ